MSTTMKFTFGSNVFQFEEGASYPAARPIEKTQTLDRTAGGAFQSEDLGITLRRRVLTFVNMNKTDYDSLSDWFDNIVNGVEQTFDFMDERGFEGPVKFIETIIDFPEVDFELFSGSLTVEYQP